MRFYVLVIILFPSIAFCLSGKVVKIQDGDTITVLSNNTEIKVRLYGIDCPEKRQAFGQAAKKFTSDAAFGKIVDVEEIDTDRYGRVVGLVSVDGSSLNEAIVRAGFAWVYLSYCKADLCSDWIGYERVARAARVGLWSDQKPVAPWVFRKNKL